MKILLITSIILALPSFAYSQGDGEKRSYNETTIADIRMPSAPFNVKLSYKFISREFYYGMHHCDLPNKKKWQQIYCSTLPAEDGDNKVIPVLVCRDRHLNNGKPSYISKSELIKGLKKALIWGETNNTVKIQIRKSINSTIEFIGEESGFSKVDLAGCIIFLHRLEAFIYDIEQGYEPAYEKAFIDTDELFQ
ncbi:MAG: hypothetical protein V6Z81_09080 [Parvularculales bacterium]